MVMPAAVPEAFCIGQPRLTAGLDRLTRIDRAAYHRVFGPLPRRSAQQLITMASQVDLRGRGGAGFPFARKLSAVLSATKSRKRAPVVAVNATEGEPGSVKDRMLLLRSPYLVLNGALAAATVLGAQKIVVGVTNSLVGRSVRQAAAAEPALRRLVEVVRVPDRFVSGESSSLINAMNGRTPVPQGRKSHASSSGVASRPTLLSNAETFAQLAILTMIGPDGYATAGTAGEPGTVLLTVGGAVDRPAVVEVPAGVPLGDVLDLCGAGPADGVLVGGYHGSWLTAGEAYDAPVSRAGLAAAGGTLGAGIVLVLGQGGCAIGEVARVAAYLAKESSGQCGPCKLGLPSVARSLVAIAEGSGGVEELDTLRRSAASVRGRGACSHPDGVSRFVLSAVDVFGDDLAEHFFRGGCGRKAGASLPLPVAPGELELTVDWTRCQGHGLCAHIVPELVQLDQQGFPVMLDMPVPPWLDREARQAVEMCPALALRLTPAEPSVPARAPLPPQPAALPRFVPSPSFGGVPPARALPSQAVPSQALPYPALQYLALSRPALSAAPVSSVALSRTELDDDDDVLTGTIVDLDVSEEWIAEISAGRRQTRC
ncbi:MAG TPA: NADH-ubiquinone oxidoreductase-F iron-sulfur binding region domain-containing protein [Streptosporangiaceae bacterium]